MASQSLGPYLAVGDLPRVTGLSHMQLWRLRNAGQFPEPLRFGLFTQRWHSATVRAWVRQRSRRGKTRA